MTRLLCGALAAVAALLAGCNTIKSVTSSSSDEPVIESRGLTGDTSDPRNRAKVHTELASL